MRPGKLQALWSRRLIDGFVDAGIQDVVVSPGSRSTPLVLAALARPELRIHDVIDERSASFFAVGQARVSGRPTLCIVTSGTAGAHYLPAVIEAEMSFTPLILITADRPVEHVGCGAPQAIDQLKLFGDHVRAFFELGAAEGSPEVLRGLRRIAAQAVHTTTYPMPGAVHLNVRARKPLEPSDGAIEPSSDAIGEDLGLPPSLPPLIVTHPRRLPPDAAITSLKESCLRAERGLIALGPSPPMEEADRREVLRFASLSGFPIFAEATSQLRFIDPSEARGVVVCDSMDALLEAPTFRRSHVPDLILQLGPAPTSRAWAEYARTSRHARRIVVAPFGWSDPDNSAAAMIFADIPETVRLLSSAIEASRRGPEELGGASGRPVSRWAEELEHANRAARRAIEDGLALGGPDRSLSEGIVAREVIASAPPSAWVVVGNGLSVRHLDTFAHAGLNEVRVLSQRGACGIDGLVSGAAGAASVSGDPVVLLVGDVSVLHDLNGLKAARDLSVPFAIVLIHNDGGRIFEQLPIARSAAVEPKHLDHWITSHGLSFGPAAELFGLAHYTVRSRLELASRLEDAMRRVGCTVIEAIVPPQGSRDEYARVTEAVERALAQAKEEK